MIEEIIKRAAEEGASDIHLVCGLPVKCRIDGKIGSLGNEILTEEGCLSLAEELYPGFSELPQAGELDFAGTFAGSIRIRANLFWQQGRISAAIRILNDRIPQIGSLGLPPVVSQLCDYRSGLVLVTGETGSGKSTTLAAVLDQINHTRQGHIITLEDPIEYIYTPDQCVINQREIGRDTKSYSDGLRAILREDPDVILIGEMRDLDTIETALTAAETGHLVFATLHTGSAAESIDRIISVFPEGRHAQIRQQLSGTLRVVLSQQLLPKKAGRGRAAACEVMVVNSAIRNLIREGKTPHIDSFITMSARDGSVTMDHALMKLVRDGVISMDTAQSHARDRDSIPGIRR